ncbi:helix-turn-helix transcriptional regulator [Bacillus smithii]|uniref:helix-turn-helix domain-containing protein n=1 Tax=Bacillus smithii TaxID=1479 RepID=UPI002E1B666B|nr:helix-turn-helix transcriptional regulator [Bacillus smithii]MED4928969.1 helix-turn-helix transcriptional regulator [Bacillus smithii]
MLSGKELKIKRIMFNIKAKEISEHLGVHKSYVSKMENEKIPIPHHLYIKWIEFLQNQMKKERRNNCLIKLN